MRYSHWFLGFLSEQRSILSEWDKFFKQICQYRAHATYTSIESCVNLFPFWNIYWEWGMSRLPHGNGMAQRMYKRLFNGSKIVNLFETSGRAPQDFYELTWLKLTPKKKVPISEHAVCSMTPKRWQYVHFSEGPLCLSWVNSVLGQS